jgi:uncharacterized protein
VRANQIRALAVAAGVVGWHGAIAPRLPARAVVSAAVGAGLVAVTRARLGLRPPELWRGLRDGLAIAVPIAAVVAASTAVPRVREGMAKREVSAAGPWLAFRIPVGTVWSEEAAFRAALGTVARDAFGPTGGRALQAAAFGASHVVDARDAGESVFGTVVVTAVAGWVFALLGERSGSLAAPMLAHLAINEAGAVAALAVQRR